MSLQNIIRICAAAGLLWLSGPAQSDMFVVAAAANPFQSIGPKELQAIYMGRKQNVGGRGGVQATDLPHEHPMRDKFYAQLTGMTAAQVNSHWSRLLFSGRSTPPVIFPNEEAMLSYLLRTPNALGYTFKPPPAGLKVVMVLKAPTTDLQGHAP